MIPTVLKQQVLDQLHTNHMGIKKKTKLLTHESIYWADINTDIKKHIKICTTCLEFQQMQHKEKYYIMTYPSGHVKYWAQMFFTLIIRTIYAY